MTGKKHIKKEDKNPKTPAEPQKKSKIHLMSKRELEALKSHLELNNQQCSRRYCHVTRRISGLIREAVKKL
jgi:hypothetical protein